MTEAQPTDPAPHFAYARLLRDEIGDQRAGADREFRAFLSLDPGGAHANEARAFLLKPVTPKTPSPAPSSPSGAPTPLPTYVPVPTPVSIPVPLPADGAEKR